MAKEQEARPSSRSSIGCAALLVILAIGGYSANRVYSNSRIEKVVHELKETDSTPEGIRALIKAGAPVSRSTLEQLIGSHTTPEALKTLIDEVKPDDKDRFLWNFFVWGEFKDYSPSAFDGREYLKWKEEKFSLSDYFNNEKAGFNLEIAKQLREKNITGTAEQFIMYHLPATEVQAVLGGESIAKIEEKYAQKQGVTVSERRSYLELDFQEQEMKTVKVAGFNPEWVGDYVSDGYKDNAKIKKDKLFDAINKGLNATTASKWESEEFDQSDIVYAAQNKINLDAALEWRSGGFSLKSVAFCKQHGYTFEEAQQWKNIGYEVQEMHKEIKKHDLLIRHVK